MVGFSSFKSNNPFRHKAASTDNTNVDDVPPPPGPPPSQRPGNAPGADSSEEYAPPPGPPPSYGGGEGKLGNDDDYTAPPPGPPPPAIAAASEHQHNWEQAVPDTSLFPPPPDIFAGWDRSPANNATEEQAEAGEAWCRQYPLAPPTNLDSQPHLRGRGQDGNNTFITPRLIAPPAAIFGGGSSLEQTGPGTWTIRAGRSLRHRGGGGDCCIMGSPQSYLVQRDSPLATGRPATIYFECRVGELGRGAGLAIGFQALPYPQFRMPGWHRGSLAVHGDDGHRYVNDRWGGKDFTEPFKKGEIVGIGMVFSPVGGQGPAASSSSWPSKHGQGSGGGGAIQVEVFFTRSGRETGRWDLHESLDAEQDLPVTGLEGFNDLTVAIGTFGSVGADVVLDRSRWAFKP